MGKLPTRCWLWTCTKVQDFFQPRLGFTGGAALAIFGLGFSAWLIYAGHPQGLPLTVFYSVVGIAAAWPMPVDESEAEE